MAIKCAKISSIYYHTTVLPESWVSGRNGDSVSYSNVWYL